MVTTLIVSHKISGPPKFLPRIECSVNFIQSVTCVIVVYINVHEPLSSSVLSVLESRSSLDCFSEAESSQSIPVTSDYKHAHSPLASHVAGHVEHCL